MDAAHEIADLAQRRLGLLVRGGHQLPAGLGIVVELLARRAERRGERDEPLLGAVVEVAFDPPPLGLGRVDRRGAARLQVGHLLGEPLVLGRPEQPVGERPLDGRRADRHPRRDEQEADDADRQRQPP